jgi:hypothetical protein
MDGLTPTGLRENNMTAAAGEGGADAGAGQGTPQTGSGQNAEGDFTPITSQEQLDQMFGERLARKERTIRAEYDGFDDIKAKAEQFDQLQAANQTEAERLQAERDAALQAAQQNEERATKAELAALRQKVAIEENLPPKFAAKLSGTTEEELRADAKDTFGEFITKAQPFDHGPRNQSAPTSMNDLLFGAKRR